MHYAFLYKKGIRFGSNKKGPFELTGKWKDNALIYASPTGGNDVEMAKILPNGDLELHASVFDPNDTRVYLLQKVVPGPPPSPAELAAMRQRQATTSPVPDNGPHLAWPPPKGTITIGMTREDLEKIPWHRDGIHRILDETEWDESQSEIDIYTYHCDDPTLVDLVVTVKNGKVVSINGGQG